MPEPPAEFLALQVSRLNEALLVADGAMSGANLRAVDRLVRIGASLTATMVSSPPTRAPAAMSIASRPRRKRRSRSQRIAEKWRRNRLKMLDSRR